MYSLKDTLFVYINLDERVDKNIHMINLLDSIGVNYIRFSAIKPTPQSLVYGEFKDFYDKSVPYLKQFDFDDTHYRKQFILGTFGCYLSHFKILEKFASHGSIVVLEDDASFNIQSLKKFFRVVSHLNKNHRFQMDLVRPLNISYLLHNYPIDGFSLDLINNNNCFRFNSPHRFSKFSKFNKSNFYGMSHFVYYHNITNVLEYLKRELVYNIDACYSTNIINSIIVDSTIPQKREEFFSDIGKFKTTSF
tara:strand:- start:1279 stop:2025 length:747 start_codon:yes stop_codon:yes gene_type:complete